ncbi:hypothetical protein [Gracilimonas tropica]|uniref:hypothetical protein n=1 Tax=Gracilimonas tropica TaxID=454600 RepID=UPI00037F5983|nr:hypothetical protein [Gracilimonas tropica]
MKNLIRILMLLFPGLLMGQVMDESDINKLEQGKYKLEKGKVQVSFVDTVSLGYVKEEFGKLGLKILTTDFKPIILQVYEMPENLSLEELEENEWVELVFHTSANMDETAQEEIKEKYSSRLKEVISLYEQIKREGFYEITLVVMTSEAMKESFEKLLEQYPGMNAEILQQSEKSAVVETEENRELDVMDLLNELDYVKNTAMIGSLE